MDTEYDDFIKSLRSALNNLFALDQLRRNPLIEMLGLSGRVDASAALQKTLIAGVENLKPDQDDPGYARAWQAHDLLYLRYVRGYSREEVAGKLGISDRQLSREQQAAIAALALALWESGQMGSRAAPDFGPQRAEAATAGYEAETPPGPDESTSARVESEGGDEADDASWIKKLPEDTPSAWSSTFHSVLDLLGPLMEQHDVRLRYEPNEALPDLFVPPNTLRQSLLIVLGWLIPAAQTRQVSLVPQIESKNLVVKTAAELDPARAQAATAAGTPGVAVLKQLLDRVGGSYRVDSSPDRLEVTITIPALAQVPVLVIDDNLDTINLFQRSLQETRYALVGVSDPDDIERQIARYQPLIILLDVMMPEVDGWELLVRLRQYLDERNVAILICSILPLENLALSLGANGFLQKPVLPQALISRLDEQLALLPDGV